MPANTKGQTVLWSVLSPDKTIQSYLYGTMHVRDKRAFKRSAQALSLLQQCSALALEFNFDEIDPEKLGRNQFIPADQPGLFELAGKSGAKKLKRLAVKVLHMAPEALDRIHPFHLINIVGSLALTEDENHSLDETLFEAAKQQAIPVIGLESFDSQIDIIESTSMKSHVKQLLDGLDNYDSMRKKMDKLAHWYEQGDLQSILKSTKKQLGKKRDIYLYSRNKVMAQGIAETAVKQSLFAAVGAAHLPGQKGVISLLKAKGFKVKAIL